MERAEWCRRFAQINAVALRKVEISHAFLPPFQWTLGHCMRPTHEILRMAKRIFIETAFQVAHEVFQDYSIGCSAPEPCSFQDDALGAVF